MKSQRYRKPLSVFLSIAMVLTLLPAQALAEALDEAGALEVVEEEVQELGAPEEEDEELGAPEEEAEVADEVAEEPVADAAPTHDVDDQDELMLSPDDPAYYEEPFFFKDLETDELTTTLHTSGSYQLVKPDGTLYTDSTTLSFDLLEDHPRYPAHYYDVHPKAVRTEDYEIEMLVLEDFTASTNYGTWQLPTGRYRVREASSGSILLQQVVRVVNDGLFKPQFDFCGSELPTKGKSFTVKAYSGGKSDEEYDGTHYSVHENGSTHYDDNTPDQDPFVLNSDTRLRFSFYSGVPMNEDTMPRLESISLWRADESLETYVGTVDAQTGVREAKYRDLNRSRISRVSQILAKGNVDDPPTFPTYLNFNDESQSTTLWQRGDASLDERVVLSDEDDADSITHAAIIIDRANFASVVAEDGLYFPIVRVTIAGETYTYAYFPIDVNATDTSPRNDPTIKTTSLKKARVGDAYTATLKGKSGVTKTEREDAEEAGTYSLTWSVSDGALPEGLALNPTTGVIAGTPTQAGEQTFTIALTESVYGTECITTRDFALVVQEAPVPETAVERLALGEISYDPGTRWLSHVYWRSSYVNLRIPISIDVSDPIYNLQETELWYLLRMETAIDDGPVYRVWVERAADLMSDDGTTLEVGALMERGSSGIVGTKRLTGVRAFLVPKTNDGAYAFDPGELYYNDGSGPLSAEDYEDEYLPYDTEPVGIRLMYRYGSTSPNGGDSYTLMNYGSFSYVQDYYYYYPNLPEMPYTELENPDITFGSWVRFPALSFEGSYHEWPTERARVRIWPYDGTTTPTKQQVKELSANHGVPGAYGYDAAAGTATFKLAPGTYAFVVEGEIPVYDEMGVKIGGATAWVDIAGKVRGARAIKGTSPTQYVYTLGPGEGTDGSFTTSGDPVAIDVTYTTEYMNTDRHTLVPTFELEDGRYVSSRDAGTSGYVTYQTAWYRRTGDESSDVLVATGDTVMFGTVDYPLYVELTPTGRDASFWKSTGKVLVSDKNRVVSLQVDRKQRFTGEFALSCASGKTPAAGENWGIIEVRTPLASGKYSSYNVWPDSDTARISNLTSGSEVTFTPRANLDAGPVTYVVPEDAEANFQAELMAPLVQGAISFEGLTFTDANGTTAPFTIDDGATDLSVKRVISYDGGQREIEYSVPFYISDSMRIVLQPERYYGDYYLGHEEETTYRITLTHRDPAAPDRMGVDAADYAARQVFEVTLSKTKTSASVDSAELVSRGYALVSFDNPSLGSLPCTLLLYATGQDDEGHETSQLVDKSQAGAATQLRTPFLQAGTYTLYAVDSNRLSQNESDYGSISKLRRSALGSGNQGHGSSVSFVIADQRITELKGDERLVFPNWTSEDLIDHGNSSVSIASSYTDKVTISMHAQLAAGMELPADAYLELRTNQESHVYGEGYMSPKALSLNGHALVLNRWENLFKQTQNLSDGRLVILLSEARKVDESCGAFPLDMTLIIPRTDYSYAEASIWLVSNDGETRSLIGTARKETHEATITAPSVVAWKDFYVRGETGPNALVSIYVNGMRAGTTSSDDYGSYTAEVSLPDDVRDFDEFSLSATSFWMRGDMPYVATSPTTTVTYSTIIPVVESITMCYQPNVGEDYQAIESYYRGMLCNQHRSIYRAEHDNRTTNPDDHAKDFWVVTFANGDDLTDVKVTIPHSSTTSTLQTTSSLATAEQWIPDVKKAEEGAYPYYYHTYGYGYSGFAGGYVRDALSDADTCAYVTKPSYFTMSPDDIEISFEVEDPMRYLLTRIDDDGPYVGYADEDITRDELAAFIWAMGETDYVYVCSEDDAASLKPGQSAGGKQLTSPVELATSLKEAEPGCVDEWMVVGGGIEGDGNSLLKVHHQVTTTDCSATEIEMEVQDLLNEADPIIDAYETWLETGEKPEDESLGRYKGAGVVDAIGMKTTRNASDLYFIDTIDAEGNVALEVLRKYRVGSSNDVAYELMRMDKQSYTSTTWNEKYSQCVTYAYTISPDQVSKQAEGDAPVGFVDLIVQWSVLFGCLHLGWSEACAFWREGLVDVDDSGLTAPADEGDSPMLGAPAENESPSRLPFVLGVFKELVGGVAVNEGLDAYDKAVGNPTQQDLLDHAEHLKQNTSAEPDGEYMRSVEEHGSQFYAVMDRMSTGMCLGWKMSRNAAWGTAAAGKTPEGVTATLATPPAQEAIHTGCDGILDKYWRTPPVEEIQLSDKDKYKIYVIQRFRQEDGFTPNYGYFTDEEMNKFSNRYYNEYIAWGAPKKRTKAKNPPEVRDPSGFVYEAVLSNPVEGATVQLYTFNPAAYSAQLDPGQFVDAGSTGIQGENPQMTGEDGRYQWMVPEGWWQVRVSKQGYASFSTGDWGHSEQQPTYQMVEETLDDEGNTLLDADGNPTTRLAYRPVLNDQGEPFMETVDVGDYGIGATKKLTYTNAAGEEVTVNADSYWMPVLPEQLEVNIPLVSYEAPKVASVEADRLGVTVTFSKYMKADTVVAGMFAIDGDAPASFEAIDAEQAADGSGVLLARTFRLGYPEDYELQIGSSNLEVTVTFNDESGVATSYAGMGTDQDARSESFDCTFDSHINIAEAEVAAIPVQTYNGDELTPSVEVSYGGADLVEGTDYTVEYANNTDAGTATVTIKGKGGFTSSVKKTFEIQPMPVTVTAYSVVKVYGEETPTFTASMKGTTDGDWFPVAYSLSCEMEEKVGTYDIVATGERDQGNYVVAFANGTLTVNPRPVTVTADDLSKVVGTDDPPLTATVEGALDGEDVVYALSREEGEDVGTYAITPSGAAEQGNYAVTFVNGTFAIYAPLSLAGARFAIPDQTYSGSAIDPSRKAQLVTADGAALVAGEAYRIAYQATGGGARLTDGLPLECGTYTATATGIEPYCTGSAATTFKVVKQRVTWKRLWGNTALDTMQAIAKEFGSAKVAVVTTNADFHDALAASALAGANGALVLTTAKGSASKQTKAALKAAGVKTVYVVGRTSDVSKAAMNGLKYASGVTVKRVADKAGYSARAIELAKACGKRSDTVIIATQASFKDALSIAPYSYATKSPILYAETNKKLSDATLKYIKGAKFKRAIIVGGPLALSTEIEGQLKSKGGITSASNVMRLAGADPYATSEVIAKWATGQYKNGSTAGPYQGKMLSTIRFQPTVRLSANKLAVSTSRTTLKWKDALCGAALCGKNKGVLLLADDYDANGRAKNNYAKAVDFCHAGAAGMSRAYVLGGEAAVSKQVWNALVASTVV